MNELHTIIELNWTNTEALVWSWITAIDFYMAEFGFASFLMFALIILFNTAKLLWNGLLYKAQ